ncbi:MULTISPECIES: hypothetical protein [Enterobacteriaceae]|uniref:Uncharacterized protein n=1 Tax=Enterobacter wuhouensis TaxID=2529381 RepID=A0A4R0GAX3_9ENTR|nr:MULTISPECIES: hypothetical protein [Enterobacteriaceae]MCL9642075.1 hypothetical protein [Rahnella victoriana]HDX4251298.1 hypothetical protein [Klebsiella oxytoca]MDM6727456.1 hypothetical protein [Klebsiella grimontii]MDM7224100.1 hypothetical protein [Klebsiella grimontii]MDM7237463.1 hypothetical protein [Klebsiella grimontii]
MKKLKGVISAAALSLFLLTPAHALPNMWTSGFGQGVAEYIITSPEKVVFNLNCTTNPDAQNILQHGVDLTLPDGTSVSSHDDRTEITVVMDNSQYSLPSFLGWRNGDNAWVSFINALAQAATFDVYINDKKAGTFSPGLKNTQKELSDLSGCRTIYYSD